jgi:TMEM175 potassium channel family protein
MKKTRLEAFSDGVIAIIITIMVLELKTPHETSLEAIKPLFPVFISYVLSFVVIGIYWGNHHHLLHTVSDINSKILWSNLHLLFWLSLIPFATAWMGENNFDNTTVAVYAALLAICGVAYFILLRVIAGSFPHNPKLLLALQKQSKKGMMSLTAYTLAIPAAYLHAAISAGLFILVAILWMIPDRNIEKSIKEHVEQD